MSEQNYEAWDDEEKEVIICKAKKESAQRIQDYLKYSDINSYTKDTENEDTVEIIVSESEADKALQYLSSFLAEEKKRALNENEDSTADNIFSAEDLETGNEVFEVNAKSHSYQTNSEKYNASMSSAFAFMIVGTGVLVLIALAYCDIINLPVKFSDNPMLSIILPIMAAAFEVIAVISWRQAQKYRGEIGSEQQFDTDIKEWFINKYNAEAIDSLCINDIHTGSSSTVSIVKETNTDNNSNETTESPESTDNCDAAVPDEIRFLQRLEAIEKIINDNYPDLDKGYVDILSEELYQKLFDAE